MEETKQGMPVYVKLDEYKDIIDVMGLIRNKIQEARNVLDKLNELKNEEDSELEIWKTELDDVEKKIEFMDKAMFEPTV